MKVAAVDIGTNTVRLLLAEVVGEPGHRHVALPERHEVITKLGEGLDATGRLSEEAMTRALTGLQQYARLIAESGAVLRGGVATEATRSATNSDVFMARAADTLGFHPRVIDGVEEADLTFRGATNGLQSRSHSHCIVDVGGGSTEFVIGRKLPDYAISVGIGSVRLTERFQALGISDAAAQRDYVDSLFSGVSPPYPPTTVLGSGGTFVTLGAVARDLSKQAAEDHPGLVLSLPELTATVDRLLAMTVAEIAALSAVPAARAGVLHAGAICAERAVGHIGGSEVGISVADILDGLALHLAEEGASG